ncbi:MAG TPA: TonB-dependent receptor [Candidatus Dormibacteraeota bacterium]|nr:TonB-dependent receptor [Candidatus Dormibacteraeota bacterium]
MRKYVSSLFLVLMLNLVGAAPIAAQTDRGAINGTVKDTSGAVLPGARVELQQGPSAVSDEQGQFTITNIAPGTYTATVNYVGFAPSTNTVTLIAGQIAHLNIVMNVASARDSVIVVVERAHGEVEAINESRTSDNILNVLPAEVITSLPNANIADAVGRLPGVTLERDEGEGKYVQIRGTEPRLSNLTIDGVEVPSPEGGIRQVKLDVVPTEMIEMVQINKTLQANQDGDAIGGTVNLVTKTAGERPTLSIFGNGGFTPIIDTRPVSEFGLTTGNRFGAQKRWGALLSGSYDYNGRGINDIEPVPGSVSSTDLTPAASSMDIREYKYNRNRYGLGGNLDYKLGESSVVFVRGLFSDFKDSGRRWAYTLNDINTGSPGCPPLDSSGNPTAICPGFNTEIRAAHYQVASVLLGGNHVFSKYYSNWGLAASRARVFNPINGGESIDTFTYAAAQPSQCTYDVAATTNPLVPQWSPICYTEAYNPSNFVLSQVEDANHGQASQLNLQAQISGGRLYQAGSHTGRFEMGFRIRNAHKFDDSFENFYSPTSAVNPTTITMAAFPTGLTDKNYYGGHYQLGPLASWDKILQYFRANPGNFFNNGTGNTYGTNPANFDLIERVTAGYLMNTIDIGRFTLVTGVRFEGTTFNSLSVDQTQAVPCLCSKASGSYIDVLPSASLRIRIDNNSGIRLIYGRGLSRPLPQQLTTSVSLDTSTAPPTYTIGAVLKPEHANNYDVLYERYLTPLGLFQAGFFYKSISDPIVTNVTLPSTGPYAGFYVATPANAGTAYVTGLELAFQQHFTYLPGALSGLGISANYSYTTSGTTKVDQLRTDNPALLRQAPNTWNISPTYDRKQLSVRVGLAYNGPNIFQYQYHDLQFDPNNPGKIIPNPQPGGIKGPSGDNYLYAHYQVDAQGSYYLGKGLTLTAAGLNLNNAVFGFYNGGPQYVVQREYYRPTYTFGFRWDLQHER